MASRLSESARQACGIKPGLWKSERFDSFQKLADDWPNKTKTVSSAVQVVNNFFMLIVDFLSETDKTSHPRLLFDVLAAKLTQCQVIFSILPMDGCGRDKIIE